MNKRIDFSFNGGFPATQYTTAFLQDSFRGAFIAMAGLIGDKVIVAGMQEAGGNVSNGWISYNGELIPFTGGPFNADSKVTIVETPASRVFDDGQPHDVYFEKVAKLGSVGLFPYSDLKRIGQLKDIALPKGTVLMWSGDVQNIPTGFALCNGENGTPNLSGMFIVGFDANDPEYNAIGKTGGSKKHQLTIAEMPAHSHSMEYAGNAASGSQGQHLRDAPSAFPKTTGSTGGNEPHENRPPFYTLAYIIKLK